MSDRAAYRRYSSRRIPPVPIEFVDQFLEGGYRRIERIYGGRNDLVRKWMEMAGGEHVLKAMRRARLSEIRRKS
ncbi:hypothetical protein EIK56_18025 [Sphingomonas sp. C8-2]|nr:hypothetical protein EIK56_18025 [Sphingomonas sp. C8-2]